MVGGRAHPPSSHHYIKSIHCMTTSVTNMFTEIHHIVLIIFIIIQNEIMISLVTFHLFINSVHTEHYKRIFYTFLEFVISGILKFWGHIVLCTILTTFKWAPDCILKFHRLFIKYFMSLILWLLTKQFVGRVAEFDIKRSKTFIEMTVSPSSFLNNGLKWNLDWIPQIVKFDLLSYVSVVIRPCSRTYTIFLSIMVKLITI